MGGGLGLFRVLPYFHGVCWDESFEYAVHMGSGVVCSTGEVEMVFLPVDFDRIVPPGNYGCARGLPEIE